MKADDIIRMAKPNSATTYKMSDGGNLWFFVHPSGQKFFSYLCDLNGERKLVIIGKYPCISLELARIERTKIDKIVKSGLDISSYYHFRSIATSTPAGTENDCCKDTYSKICNGEKIDDPFDIITDVNKSYGKTFYDVAIEWYDKRISQLNEKTRLMKKNRLEKHVFPFIGDMLIKDIKFGDLIEIISTIESNKHAETVRRVAQEVTSIFCYAKIMRYVENNVAYDLRDTISIKKSVQHRSALINREEIGELLRNIDKVMGSISVRYALQIMPYVFVRSSELRSAKWNEIDFEKKIWIIPAEHMKMNRDHVVPLARQVINKLKELINKCGKSEFIFPSPYLENKYISNGSLLACLRRLGYNSDQMCIHGFRSIASTQLNEMGFRSDIIEMQLSHVQENKVRAAYNRAIYLEERRDMMQKWADFLDKLRLNRL